jgi:hypothetical protein
MRKILVLENVNTLEDNFNNYLSVYHKNDDVKIIFNLSSNANNKATLHTSLAWADELHIASSFYDNEQFEHILGILLNFKNIKIIRILYLYSENGDNKFINFLNEQDTNIKQSIITLLKHCVLFEICSNTYEVINKKSTYFKKFKYTFDIVPIYYNEEHILFWYERQPVVPNLNSFLYLDEKNYKTELYKLQNKIKGKKVYLIDNKDNKDFLELLNETKCFVENQLDKCKIHDFGNSKELIIEKKKWLKILNEIKVL